MTEHFASTDDNRTVNNTVRHQYRVLSDEEKQKLNDVKDKALEFIELVRGLGQGREYSIAITKAEEASMWAVRGITA
ncbi:hypothetical protein [Caudoviricetes sp.]|nr:hypothetical protein [Caudoviricetes sp.]